MKTKLTIAAALAALLVGAQAASAQQYSQQSSATQSYAQSAPPVQNSLGYGSYNYGGGFYESSLMEGAGSLLAGAGSYNLQTAQAIDTMEMAKAKYAQNYRDAIDARYAIKRANDMYRGEKFAKERMTPELLGRVISAKLPDRLSAAEYDRRTGELNWPAVLTAPQFSADRQAIEQAFAQRRGEDVGVTSIFYREVSQRAQRMHSTMLAQIDSIPTADSIAARKFLKRIEYEARHLPEATGLAINR